MIKRNEILNYLRDYLHLDDFDDSSINGLQVEGNPLISKIITGVSISERLIQAAIHQKAQCIIVHHGLLWRSKDHPLIVQGSLRQRLRVLLDNHLNLAAYHLPLDAHIDIGNNSQILKALDLLVAGPFDVGHWGEYENAIKLATFKRKLDATLPQASMCLQNGPSEIKRVAVISGGASLMIEGAAALGADTFISGDLSEPVPRLVEELGMNFFSAGHYNSERFGPIALCAHLREVFQIDVEFIDIENPA